MSTLFVNPLLFSSTWLSQVGEIAMFDLGIESGEPGGGEVAGETRQTGPALLYDAHNGRLMKPTLKWLQY